MKNDQSQDTTPQEPVVTPHQVNETKASANETVTMSSKSKKKLFLAVATIIVLAIGIGVAVYLLVLRPSDANTAADTSLAAAKKFDSPQALIDAVEPRLKGAAMQVGESTGLGASDENGYVSYSPPAYRLDGFKFSNLPLKSNGVGYIATSEVAKDNYKTLVAFFEDSKFHRIVNEKDGLGNISSNETGSYVSYAEYESSELLCSVRHADASGTDLKSHVSSVGCAEKVSYKAAADKLQAFYKVYSGGDDSHNVELMFGIVDQGKGTDGYEYAVIYQQDPSQFEEQDGSDDGAFLGYYLKAPGESEWKYFEGVQEGAGMVLCSVFKDKASKSAFNDFKCFDEATDTETVVR